MFCDQKEMSGQEITQHRLIRNFTYSSVNFSQQNLYVGHLNQMSWMYYSFAETQSNSRLKVEKCIVIQSAHELKA